MMRTLCVILARAGSKGLLNKNVLAVAGRPMIAHTIEHARAAACLEKIVVSTDGPAIAQAARELGVRVVDRPAELAGDTATVAAAARHAIETVERESQTRYDAVVILYGNVPLRPADLIDRAIAKLAATGADSVQSVSPVGKMHPYWMKTLGGPDGDVLQPYQANSVDRRQDLPPVYSLDGGIIAVRRDCLLSADQADPHAFLGRDRRAILTQRGEVIDVDTAADLAIAEAALAGRPAHPPAVTIAGRTIGPDQPVYVIAELGVNHDGSLDRAMALADAAKNAGADAIKIQCFDPRKLLSAQAMLAEYQRSQADDVFAMLEKLQLDADAMAKLRDKARAMGLGFIATCFSLEDVAVMRSLDVDAVKIASPDCVNLPLLESLKPLGKAMLVSTGAATIDELQPAARLLADHPTVFLQCVSAYPVADGDAALGGIGDLPAGFVRGYSDHTTNVQTGMLTAAAGAAVIEKHLTYDRSAVGPDHAASFEADRFAEYVRLIRQAESMRGEGGKRLLACERDVRRVSRQSVCVVRDLPAGYVLRRADLTLKRPGTGIMASRLPGLIGRRLVRPVQVNHLLREDDVA